jgi:transposase
VPTRAGRVGRLGGDHAREQLAGLALPHAAQQQIEVALAIVEPLNALLAPLDLELERDARRLHGCRALMAHYRIGAKVATAILAELGDPRRFSSSRQARSLRRLGHHRARVRRAPPRRAPVTPGIARAALGGVRSGTHRRASGAR